MLNIPNQLRTRSEPIQVGIVGAGFFGTKLADQIECAPGMKVAGIADIEPENAKQTYQEAGVTETVTWCETPADAQKALGRNHRVIMEDGIHLAETPIDVLVESTGIPTAGARHAYKAINAGIHVVNVTVELDSVVGPTLSKLASENNVTYSYAYGDQPALMVELYDWAKTIGMDVIAAGRGSMYRDEFRHGTPDDIFERFGYNEAFVEEHNLNPQMYNSFLDGTKIAIENCALANATGLTIDTPGMHHRTLEVADIPETLRPEETGGILSEPGVVETVSSLYPDGSQTAYNLSSGMFVVTTSPNPAAQQYLHERDESGFHVSEDGDIAVFYRPFHLPGIETPVSIASAVLRNEPTGTPRSYETEVVGAAKQHLSPGDTLDGGGGYTTYGILETRDRAEADDLVPFELLAGATVTSPLEQDEQITYDTVDLEDSFLKSFRNDPGIEVSL